MDFLTSLNIHEVPEQQTRTSDNEKIIKALSSNPNIKLGFDACCHCGFSPKSLDTFQFKHCSKCKRIAYCTKR